MEKNATATSPAHVPLLETRQLTKTFGDLIANDRVDLILEAGQVHAVLGENGAGKSTLMKMLYGVYAHDGGTVLLEGEPVSLHPPALARAHGIGMVFQDFRLIPALSVLENIAIAASENGFRLRKRSLRRQIVEISEKYQIGVDPDAYVWQLDLGQRQRVEILKVLVIRSTRIIIFDEPTSVLTPHEVDAFLSMLGRLRADGYGILLITHKIGEVLASADRVTVLRAGKVTFSGEKGDGFDGDELVSHMMGKTYVSGIRRQIRSSEADIEVARIEGVTVTDDRGREILRSVDLSFRKGEIVGVAGISGNGQRELAETLYGIRTPKTGRIILGGEDVTHKSTKDFIDRGVGYVSEDPLKESVIPGFSILEHMVLSGLRMEPKGWGVDWSKIRDSFLAFPEVKTLGVAAPERQADRLSGGNVQRMVLARALLQAPQLLVISYPSRGLDIGTVKSIQELLIALRDRGSSIVLISEDLTELFELSDRLIVLGNQQVYGPYDPGETDPYRIGYVMLKGETA